MQLTLDLVRDGIVVVAEYDDDDDLALLLSLKRGRMKVFTTFPGMMMMDRSDYNLQKDHDDIIGYGSSIFSLSRGLLSPCSSLPSSGALPI